MANQPFPSTPNQGVAFIINFLSKTDRSKAKIQRLLDRATATLMFYSQNPKSCSWSPIANQATSSMKIRSKIDMLKSMTLPDRYETVRDKSRF